MTTDWGCRRPFKTCDSVAAAGFPSGVLTGTVSCSKAKSDFRRCFLEAPLKMFPKTGLVRSTELRLQVIKC